MFTVRGLSPHHGPSPKRVSLYHVTNDFGLRRRELDLYGFGGRLGPVRKSEFSKDGSLLAVVGFNHNIALYDAATGNQRLVPRRAPEPATPS